ncbi:vinorine synthase-like [Carica papaya]|uniref:vinorine synthase-like n=1 Tax=Carica papaya TaxID=3649 RepID=UPI000B8CF3E0|nr:vinorine synthase-like [Carica papaya]
MDHFLPTSDHETMTMSNGAMLLVKFTSFICGGVALSLSLTHKLADLSSLVTLLQTWTKISLGDNELVVPELFLGANLLPCKPDLPNMSASINIKEEKFSMKRFVFSATKLAEIKARVDPEFEQVMHCHASRVEMVLALIWKCAVAAKQAKNMGEFKPSVMFQAVNLRQRMSPLLPENAMGNFIWPFMLVVKEENDMELVQLVIQMRKSFNHFCNNDVNKFKGKEGIIKILEKLKEREEFFKKMGDTSVYRCSSWCKFPLYDADFGWGKALWHVSVNKMVNNTVALMDTRSRDEIEVILTLDEEEMKILETNQELLEYATINPSIN